MIKEARKSVIGGFVIGALVLSIAGILAFGSGDFFKKTSTYVLLFEDSIKGLNIGAPVLFKGVQIGMVTDISLEADLEEMVTRIPVLIEIDSTRWKVAGDSNIQVDEGMNEIIEKGLKANLEMQSLVTGKYVIQLDFHPEEAIVFRAASSQHPEIPTFRAGLSKLSQTLENLPIGELFKELISAVSGLDTIIHSESTQAFVPAVSEALFEVQQFIKKLDAQVDPLSTSYIRLAEDADKAVTTVSSQINDTAKVYKILAQGLETQVQPLAEQIRMTAESLRHGVATAEETLDAAKGLISNDSPVFIELTKTLKELSAATRSIRVWADYLERHPEALIQGKGRR